MSEERQLYRIESLLLEIRRILGNNVTAVTVNRIDANVKTVSKKLDSQAVILTEIEEDVNGAAPPPPPPPLPPVSAASYFSPPVHRKGVLLMNYDLKNDWVVGPVAIVFKDASGNVVPDSAGASFSPIVSDLTLLNVVMNDGTHFTMNALKMAGTATITWTEATGMVPAYTDTINIVEDLTPTAADSDFIDAAHTTQPVPTS